MDTEHPSGNFETPLPADTELDRLAVQRAEQEEAPRMPATPEEMVAATLDPTHGCFALLISALQRTEAGSEIGVLSDLVFEVEDRMTRRLKQGASEQEKKKSAPSAYAALLHSCATPERDESALRGLAELSSYVVAEFNPLLHRIGTEYERITATIPEQRKREMHLPSTREEIFRYFTIGRVEQDRVYSAFGLLDRIAEGAPDFPQFNTEQVELPKKIVVLDPFGADQASYWENTIDTYRQMYNKELSLPAVVTIKSAACVYELRELMIHSHDSRVCEAAEFVIFWMEGELSSIYDMSQEQFTAYIKNLHFGVGDPSVGIALLNQLEILKQQDESCDLFCQMLGVRTHRVPTEGSRSVLFGNIFHEAFYRTAHLRLRRKGAGESEGQKELTERLDGSTNLSIKQAPIVDMNDDDWAALLRQHIQTPEEAAERAPALIAAMTGATRCAYLLRKLLVELSIEGRGELLDELRIATPREFERLMLGRRLLPEGIEWYGDPDHKLPLDVVEVVRERGFDDFSNERKSTFIYNLSAQTAYQKAVRVAAHYSFLPWRAVVGAVVSSLDVIVSGVPDSPLNLLMAPIRPFMGAYEEVTDALKEGKAKQQYIEALAQDCENTLWKTTPSEKLLDGDEFYKYIKGITDRIKKRGGIGSDIVENQNDIRKILDILVAHEDIGKVGWFAWFARQAGAVTGEKLRKSEVAQTLRCLFQHIPADFLQTETEFFRLYQFVFDYTSGFITASKSRAVYTKVQKNGVPKSADDVPGIFEGYAERGTIKSIIYFLTHFDTIPQSHATSNSRSLRNFDDVGASMDSLTGDEKDVMENLKLFTKLIEPVNLVHYIDLFFRRHPGAFAPFCEILSQEDRTAFLREMCENVPGLLHSEWWHLQPTIRFVAAAEYLAGSEVSRDARQVTLLYTILSESERYIPDNKEYQNLKKLVREHGYETNAKPEVHRRIRFDEGERVWVLEEGERKLPAKGDVLNLAEMRKVLKSVLEWREIARG